MKQLLLSTLFTIGITSGLIAQDIIYTASGNKIENARLTGVSGGKVSFEVQTPTNQIKSLTFQRQNILFAFSRTGNFLVISELGDDLPVAEQRLKAYMSAPPCATGRDYIIKAIPLTVIPALITFDNETVVNYKARDGRSGSISKAELIGIIRRDGRHELLRRPDETTLLLIDVKKELDKDCLSSNNQSQDPSSVKRTVPSVAPVQNTGPVEVEKPVNGTSDITGQSSSPSESSKLSLSDNDYQLYRKKALQRVDAFVSYLNVITDKKLSTLEKDNAIAQAAGLFMPAATIEVTSKSRPGARRYPVREYLTRLKLLPYSSAKIEWSEIQFIKEMSQAADGNYYGVITGQQTFVGYGNKEDDVVYSDVTPKRVRVKLERGQVSQNGDFKTVWNLLLGNIGVSAN